MHQLNDKKTDIAWTKLYARLDTEGLIEQKQESIKNRINTSAIKYAATIAILTISLFGYSYLKSKKIAPMVTLECTEEFSTLMTSLEDGSVIGLGNQSIIEYPESFSSEKREVFLSGNAYFDIASDNRSFIIKTDKVTVEVLGTSFCIEENKTDFSLFVQRGKVKVFLNNKDSSVFVGKDEQVSFESNKLVKKNISSDIFTKYLNQVHFKDQRLGDIIHMVNLNSDSITLHADPLVKDRTLTLAFTNQDTKQMAELIALALSLKTKQDGSIITIY